MNFTFDKSTLLKEISIAQEIITQKTPLSVLSNVLLEASNDSLNIKATDTNIKFETKVPVTVIEEGTTTIRCDKFQVILNSLPDGEIEFSQSSTNVTIKPTSKKIKFNLKCIESSKFPEISFFGDCEFFEIPIKTFKQMVQQTIFSVSDQENRLFMNGVYLEKEENSLVMVGTDGKRLAYVKKECENTIPNFKGSIIPPKVLSLIMKKSSDEGMISIGIEEKEILFKFGMYNFSSSLIEGQFPNYKRVIPDSQEYVLEVEKADFIEAIKRASLIVEKKLSRIFIKAMPGTLAISAENSDIGEAKEEIPCKYDDKEVLLAINCRHIEEPIRVMDSQRVKIEFSEGIKALIVKPEPESDYFHVIMPMMVD